jgi:hypothetical protein
MKTVTHVCWFTHLNTTIGIIILENSMKELRSYIGIANSTSEYVDIKFIAEYGSKFSLEAAQILMKEKGMKVNYILEN